MLKRFYVSFKIHGTFLRLLTFFLFLQRFYLKNVEKWHTHIINNNKQQIK